jgi:hypothetical protein
MGLERWGLWWEQMEETPCGDWVRYTDVDHLLARIRVAVAAERGAAFTYERAYDAERHGSQTPTGSLVRLAEWHAKRAALDALLKEVGV